MSRLSPLLVATLALGTLAGASGSESWGGFYSRRSPAPEIPVLTSTSTSTPKDTRGLCLNAILKAQVRYDIPDNLLLGIGLQEAGITRGGQLTVWPWAANAKGQGQMFASRTQAMEFVAARQAMGEASIDVGCMQINLRWHPKAFNDLAQAFDPIANVEYAARLLVGLYQQAGDWTLAAGRYHSRSPDKQKIYLARLTRNQAVANKRLKSLTRLAALSQTPSQALNQVSNQPVEQPVDLAQPRSFWTASLSLGPGTLNTGTKTIRSARYRSLYSRQDLQPLLPQFTANF